MGRPCTLTHLLIPCEAFYLLPFTLKRGSRRMRKILPRIKSCERFLDHAKIAMKTTKDMGIFNLSHLP